MNQTIVAQASMGSPLGPLLLTATERGLAGVWFDADALDACDAPLDPSQRHIAQASDELARYFAHRLRLFTVALDPAGTEFQRAVWTELLGIEFGRTRSYADIAHAVGAPKAVRAVGGAVGRNPLAVIVPCHRVIGSDGTLTGYAGGLDRKVKLLRLEGVLTEALV